MRILILNQFYIPDISPTAHLAASLAEDRAARGDEVTVLTSRGGYVAAGHESKSRVEKNLRIERLWTPQFGKSTHLRRLADYAAYYFMTMLRALTLPRQDVIVSLTTPPFIALAGVLHKAAHPSTRLLIWNMDCYPDVVERYGLIQRDGFLSFLLRRFNRLIFESVDLLIGLDDAMIDLLRSQYTPPHLRHTVIPNWENKALFSNGLVHLDGAKIPDAEAKFTILYLGNTGYGHNFDTVLDAAEMLKDEPIQFAFYGGGSRWAELEAAKNARKLDNVLLHTYVPKELTPALMSGARCALITLRDDALGVMSPSKMHANLAMGLPVLYVGPERSNVDEAIRNFDCGASLRHGSATELAAIIRRMAHDPQEYQRMRDNARSAFESAYCDEKTLPRFDAVLRG